MIWSGIQMPPPMAPSHCHVCYVATSNSAGAAGAAVCKPGFSFCPRYVGCFRLRCASGYGVPLSAPLADRLSTPYAAWHSGSDDDAGPHTALCLPCAMPSRDVTALAHKRPHSRGGAMQQEKSTSVQRRAAESAGVATSPVPFTLHASSLSSPALALAGIGPSLGWLKDRHG